MDQLGTIISLGNLIYKKCQDTKYCQKQCRRLGQRVKGLLQPLQKLQAQGERSLPEDVTAALGHIHKTLQEAQQQVVKFDKKSYVEKFLRANQNKVVFEDVNRSLSDAWEELSLVFQTHHFLQITGTGHSATWPREDQQDAEDDSRALHGLSWDEESKTREESMRKLGKNLNEAMEALKVLQEPRKAIPQEQIKEIKKEELTGQEWIVLKENESCTVYQGEYYNSPVAIKVFKSQTEGVEIVRKTFKKEIRTMKKFDSPNILRIFGICIEEAGTIPRFSIVMEFCELGSLRDLLASKKDLTLAQRVTLMLGAARGLNRLHQGASPVLHGKVNSSNFLVAEGLHVKLAGFELSQTQTSISGVTRRKKKEGINSSVYRSPQRLEEIFRTKDMEAEIYSFGIVLWEIVTGKIPFEGCDSKTIYNQVVVNRYQEPLGEDCPDLLQNIINRCRAYEPAERPKVKDIIAILSSMCCG